MLPNLQALIDRGAKGILKSTIPTHSWAAWPSFLTGVDPADHGVYDILESVPGTHKQFPVTYRSIKERTMIPDLNATLPAPPELCHIPGTALPVKRLKALDVLLLLVLLPAWGAALVLHVRQIYHGRLAWVGVFVAANVPLSMNERIWSVRVFNCASISGTVSGIGSGTSAGSMPDAAPAGLRSAGSSGA